MLFVSSLDIVIYKPYIQEIYLITAFYFSDFAPLTSHFLFILVAKGKISLLFKNKLSSKYSIDCVEYNVFVHSSVTW